MSTPTSPCASPTDAPGGPTVLGSWTATLVRTLDDLALDGAGLARAAGIDPGALDGPGARVPLAASSELWRRAAIATGDPCIGLEVARRARPGTFHGLSVGFVSSCCFRHALERAVRFGRVVCSPNGSTELEEHDGTLHYTVGWPRGVEQPSHESMEAILACVVRAGRFLLGRDLHVSAVALVRPRRPQKGRFEAFFGCPVTYGADRYVLSFPVQDAGRSLPTACEDAARGADAAVRTYLERTAPGSVTDRVRSVVAGQPAGEVSAAAAAATLAMSPRTLQRRLHEEGTSLREIVQEVRIARAKDALRAGDGSVEAIGRRLGFSDAAAFRRAFRRATGTTPGRYAALDP